ncbi:L-ribulose-5-phosphate 3-epimerase UlaE [Scopulibacillus daqui]|uniref:L-ribulose-5-phosphate 3-epimerase UlaE n=1 Tax=Scopulibacillus daqui TaxID=1469162 RepID=A0ABS2Q188_9BACL|nr:L-ribulose-5-phosphate 3-epimerase UlaE [Scopulibacillus daqui]
MPMGKDYLKKHWRLALLLLFSQKLMIHKMNEIIRELKKGISQIRALHLKQDFSTDRDII